MTRRDFASFFLFAVFMSERSNTKAYKIKERKKSEKRGKKKMEIYLVLWLVRGVIEQGQKPTGFYIYSSL